MRPYDAWHLFFPLPPDQTFSGHLLISQEKQEQKL